MIWVKDNIVEIFAIIGFLYAAARGIVALTKTPKDDAAMDKVGKWLKVIAKAAGVDLKQGRHINDVDSNNT